MVSIHGRQSRSRSRSRLDGQLLFVIGQVGHFDVDIGQAAVQHVNGPFERRYMRDGGVLRETDPGRPFLFRVRAGDGGRTGRQ